MKNFRDITEAKETMVFTFGRFNPPTIGHEKLIKKVAQVAGSNPYQIYPSFTTNPKKDPLPHALKVAYMRKMFKKYAKNIIADKDSKTAINIAVKLYDEGYKNLVMVTGSDRVKEFDTLLVTYNGVDGKRHGYYKFDSIKVVSAGERDPDAEGVEGMSASKMRAAAVAGDYDAFSTGIPVTLSDADKKKLYRDVRKYMGIREERNMGDMSDFETLRDAYLVGEIWNVGDIVEANDIRGEVIRKGANYLSYVDEDNKVHKTWLHDIILEDITKEELSERNYRKEYDNYQGRPEQIARRSSRNKARRVMGDKTKIDMDVGHKDNDPMNNDPKNLRNEDPSKNRREPRLREKEEIDELSSSIGWLNRAAAKITQITHPKGWDKIIKTYVDGMKDDEHRKNPSKWAVEVAKRYRGVDARSLVKYINTLVSKGQIPKELKASNTTSSKMEKLSFTDLVNEVKQDKEIEDKKGTQPAKYYSDMEKSTKDKRAAHFNKKKEGPAPGDASATTKPSTHTKKFKQMYGEVLSKDADQGDYIDDFQKSDAPQFKGKSKEKRKDMAIAAYLSKNESKLEEFELNEKIEGLVTKAEKSGMPYGILKKVYDRGMAAWKTGHRPGTTPQQWAFARVNSFVTKSSGTWGKADADLAKQVRGESVEEEKPCWNGFKQVGMKTKGNKQVPNCVPEETTVEACCDDCDDLYDHLIVEAEYQGKKVELNNPIRTSENPNKKFKVYTMGPSGKVVVVRFGDPNMGINRDDPKARAAFRARHSCDEKKDKTTAGYWSCYQWRASSKVDN